MSKNTKILIGVVAALAVVAAVLAIFLLGLFGGGDASVTGTIVYRERMALPDEAVARVTIVDTTSGQPLSNQIISDPGQPPISYDVPYDESQVNESLMYVVDATIEDGGGNPLFVTRQNFPVITQGSPTSEVEVLVETAGDAPPAASVFITIESPQPGAIVDISRPVQVSGRGGGLPEGNVVVQALDRDGTVLAEQPTIVDAPDAGTGGQGPWSVELNIDVATGTPGQIYAFSPSPADNSLLAEARLNVQLGEPAEDAPPTAVLEGPSEALVGEEVTFQGGNSVPGSSPIVVYAWNFGNARSSDDSPDVSVTTVYDEPGRYDVSLTVRDQNDLSDTATMQITINEREPDAKPPTAVINGPGQAVAGEEVSFDGRGSEPGNGGNIARYDWDFGDGATTRGPVAEHTYGEAGSYNVTLIVTDEAGQSSSSTARVEVSEPEDPTPEPTEEPGDLPLEGQTWTLAGTPEGVTITLLLENGAVSGSAGCNSYNASYTANNGQITISGLSAGRQVCEDDVMAAEAAYLQALPTATAYQVNGDSMTLTTAGGSLSFVSGVSAS